MKNYYDKAFYDAQKQGSLKSAEHYLAYLWTFFSPGSVVDLGCGAGTWLKAAGNLGAKKLVGYDGEWNNQQNMIDERIKFIPVNLNEFIISSEKFDLAMSLEVAEHLQSESSEGFVKSLTELSDVVIFGAAYKGQGGTNHINERLHSYWGYLFQKQGYAIFDLFRSVFWGHEEIDICYTQNTFLYVDKSHVLYKSLIQKGFKELSNLAYMNCVHPALYDVARKRGRSFREKIDRSPSELILSVKKELKRASDRISKKLFQ